MYIQTPDLKSYISKQNHQESKNTYTISIPTTHSSAHSRTDPANITQIFQNATLKSLNCNNKTVTKWYVRNTIQDETKPLARNSIPILILILNPRQEDDDDVN